MGKVIELFLVDNSLSGRMQITGQTLPVSAIQIPKSKLSEKFEELDNPGIYVLLSEDRAYIGQASLRVNNKSFAQRWYEHVRSGRDWWDKAIAFISNSADGFDSTDLNWLESEMIIRAKECGSYKIDNGNQPATRVTARKRATLEEVLDSISFLLSVINCPLLEKKKAHKTAESNTAVVQKKLPDGTYTLKPYKKTKATAVVKDGKWTILKGSVVDLSAGNAITPGVTEMRKKLNIDSQGNLLSDADLGETSPSAAGCVVYNQRCNGWQSWIDQNGKTIDIYRK